MDEQTVALYEDKAKEAWREYVRTVPVVANNSSLRWQRYRE